MFQVLDDHDFDQLYNRRYVYFHETLACGRSIIAVLFFGVDGLEIFGRVIKLV